MTTDGPRRLPNIFVTGTPGTGKSTLSSQLVEQLQQHYIQEQEQDSTLPKWQHVNVGDDWVKAKQCYTGWNQEWQSWDVDEDKLLDELEPFQTPGAKVFDWHCCDIFPERWIDLVVVLRCNHSKLWERLEKRGYSINKIQENNTAEIMNVVLEDARESYDKEIVVELESDNPDQVEDNINRIIQWVEAWRRDH
ncbi:factor activating pos9 [Microbotryomycetes sp. JL221]|nr:factor activating pos9 [Microbotryomycetes sp. JL221]